MKKIQWITLYLHYYLLRSCNFFSINKHFLPLWRIYKCYMCIGAFVWMWNTCFLSFCMIRIFFTYSSGDSWHTRSMSHSTGSAPTVPVGLEMNSPLESPPGDGIIDEGWSSGEFTNSDEDLDVMQHHRNFDRIEVSLEIEIFFVLFCNLNLFFFKLKNKD